MLKKLSAKDARAEVFRNISIVALRLIAPTYEGGFNYSSDLLNNVPL